VRLPYFEYHEPETLREALELKTSHREELCILAGGTELLPLMKFGLTRPSHIMSTGKLGCLRGMSSKDNTFRMAASTTLAELSASGKVRRMFNALYEAAESVAAPPIRNVATLAGNLCQNSRCLFYNQSETWREEKSPCLKAGGDACLAVAGGKKCFSVYQGDLAPAIAALGGSVQVEKKGFSRTISVAELFTGDAKNPISLSAEEMITAVLLPLPEGRAGSAYRKMRMRSAVDYPLLSVAAMVSVSDRGAIDSARIVIGAAGPAPILADEATALLIGQIPKDVDMDKIAQTAARKTVMIDNLVLPASYRKKMVQVFVARAVKAAIQNISEKERP
jgi:4-hydroxybenzoyl-CoA reductase subunit beta